MFWKIIYNLILLPFLFLIVFIGIIFSSKIRAGFLGRLKSKKILNTFIKNSKNDVKDVFWFHAASLGEYEQIKPVLSGLKEVEPNSYFILSVFSPSGYDYVKDDQIDCKIYLPFDFYWTIRACLLIVKPKKIIFAGYDVWPNLIWAAKQFQTATMNSFLKSLESKTNQSFVF